MRSELEGREREDELVEESCILHVVPCVEKSNVALDNIRNKYILSSLPSAPLVLSEHTFLSLTNVRQKARHARGLEAMAGGKLPVTKGVYSFIIRYRPKDIARDIK